MYAAKVFLIFLFTIVITGIPKAHNISAKATAEIIHLIRSEKFDLILPGAMRDNNVDMWIHATRVGRPDPMAMYFGSVDGYIIFTDRGGDRIERAVFGNRSRSQNVQTTNDKLNVQRVSRYSEGSNDLYDIFASPEDLKAFVNKRNPKRIAVNTSSWLAIADGISATEYEKLNKVLGPKYSSRIVSSENVITDFSVRRVQREIVAFANAVEMHRQILERALSNEVITPGVTTLQDVAWWVQEQLQNQGLAWSNSLELSIPRILYSVKSERLAPPDTRWWIHYPEYVIQRGDFGTYDIGVLYMGTFRTDYKKNFYVMNEGETSVPKTIQHAYDRAINAREIIRKNIKVGITAGDTLKAIISAMENAGYISTQFINMGLEDYKMIQRTITGNKSGFSIDLHPEGTKTGPAASDAAVGASIAQFRADRAHLPIQEDHLFSLEYMVHTVMPDRPGYPMSVNIEGNHIVTRWGVEYLHPPNDRILLIH
jgi:Xaa-Pro dipeptidase